MNSSRTKKADRILTSLLLIPEFPFLYCRRDGMPPHPELASQSEFFYLLFSVVSKEPE